MSEKSFQKTVWKYYKKHGRVLPWRLSDGSEKSAYKILVSEYMLQQTQVDRVIPKYQAFLKTFPTIKKIATASNQEVLAHWSGLGYNRRAIFLKRTAEKISSLYKSKIPKTVQELKTLDGIGDYTANAILAFAWNIPTVCIETNIRTVYIHHFFSNKNRKISDQELILLIQKTCDIKNPREWYWALMDYGAYLKSNGVKTHRKSGSYNKQKSFKGSVREARGVIIRELSKNGTLSIQKLQNIFSLEQTKISEAVDSLLREKIITRRANKLFLS